MRGTRSRKRGRPPKAPNNDSRYIYSAKLSKVEDEDEEDSNHSSSTTNTSTSKYQTRASRKPSYRIGITIERKKSRKRKKDEESEEDEYYVDDEYGEDHPVQSDEYHNSEDEDASAEEEMEQEVEEEEGEEAEEEEEEENDSIKKRLRPSRETAPLFLDESEKPELILPASSEDLPIHSQVLMRTLSIYEILRHFQITLRLTPFRFEDFCVALLIDEQTYLLSEVHVQLLKALIREDDLVGTQHGPQDVRDSISIYLFLCDHITWPEVLRIYLSSDLKKNSHIIQNYLDVNYPFSTIENKLALLEHLCDEFLNTQSTREFLNNEGIIKHEDNCRVCHKPGDLLCCETCPAVFHLTCLDPPLKQVPTEEWICPICKLNSVTGITDCMSDDEKRGFLSRQEPIGYDRHGRKYWFLSRRLIVEDHKSNENLYYYSTRLQFDELMDSLDADNYEKVLYSALEEMKEDIYRQMTITEKLTKTAKGSGTRKSYLEVVNEELYIKRSSRLENSKDDTSLHNSVNDDKIAELESKLAVDDDDLRGGVQTRLKTGSLQPKSISLDPFKNKVNVYNSINASIREEDTVITFCQDDSKTLTRTPRKALPPNFNQSSLFKLGLEGNYRQYQNIYSINQYALNKFQQADDRDKKRHLSHKFSLTQASDLKWSTYTHISTALMTTTLYGTKSLLINILRQALLYLETQFTQTFMHPNWQVHRTNWIKAVSMCSEPKEFSLALYILESSMKPVLFNSAWHDTLGFTVMHRSTQLERDELKKKDKKDRRDLNETSTLESEAANSSRYYGAGAGIKLVFGKLKHQIWKQKGEEYRLSGIGGWNWLSSTRLKLPVCEKPSVEKELCPPFDSPCSLIDISRALAQKELPLRKHYPKVFVPSKLDSLLKSRLDMFNLEKKQLAKENNKQVKCDAVGSFRCYSNCCDSTLPNKCYSPLCIFESQREHLSDNDDYGSTSEHVDLLQITTVDGVEQFCKKTIPFNSKGQLPPSSRFSNGMYRSILILPTHEMRKLGRNGGLREVTGFSYNCKINNNIWPYGLTPRPYFRTMWLLRTHYFNNLHSAALQLRVFWASIRWDDLATKPPLSGTNTITTENEVQTIEILKRRDLPPFGLRSEYLIRKINLPIDLPVRQREVSTPNRSGLRERRRPESPQVKGPRMTELWINEEEIELWEIRQFGEKAEKQIVLAKQKAAQEEKQRQLDLLRKKNEEQRKLSIDSNKMVNGSININPAKSINSRLTSIFRGGNKYQISSVSSGSQMNASASSPVTFATIRTANGTFKIPVQQNKSAQQPLIIRPGTQMITANTSQPAILNSIGSVSNVANRPTTATYIVRSPNIASNRPIIISNSLNGPIVRPINNIQTNIKQSIPLISTPQKISTVTTVNAILNSTPAKTFVSLPQSAATSTTNAVISTVNIASPSTLNTTKNIQCVQVKLNDGRTHLLPLTSLTGSNQTLQIAVNPNQLSSNNSLRILAKPLDNVALKDGQNKQILLTGNSILPPNTFILSNVNNSKVIVQPTQTAAQVSTNTTVVTSTANITSGNKAELPKVVATKAAVSVLPKESLVPVKVEAESVTTQASTSAVCPAAKASNAEEKEFVLTAEITQEIIRKALMEPTLQPEMSQKLIAYQRHHQEHNESSTAPKSPIKTLFVPPASSSRSTSRSARYSRGKYDSDDYIIDFPKSEKTYLSEEDEVTRVCKTIVKTMIDKLEKEEKRIKNREINEKRKQNKAVQLRQKYRLNHIELLRRSIIRRKAKFNLSIRTRVEKDIMCKLSRTKKISPKINTCPPSENVPSVVAPPKRKLDEIVGQSETVKEIKAEPLNESTSQNHIEESKPKRARLNSVSPSSSTVPSKKTSILAKSSPKVKSKELYCICKRPYDVNDLMIGCDFCSNWYHPICVGVAPHLINQIGVYTCPDCKASSDQRNSLGSNKSNSSVRPRSSHTRPSSRKSKPNKSTLENTSTSSHQSEELDNSLYCVCRKKYDATQFYICCDRCQDWFHGRCVGVTSAEADSIGDYICPQCEGDTSVNYVNIKDLSEADYSELVKLIKSVQSHRNAWPFLKPVDKRQVPDYYTIIKEPMDLKKIEGRLNNRTYKKLAEFIYDINKMFDNCRLYNARTSEYYQCAENLEGFFLTKIRAFREADH